jgi:hypothetical protein
MLAWPSKRSGLMARLASTVMTAARCKLTPAQLRELQAVLDAGPAGCWAG